MIDLITNWAAFAAAVVVLIFPVSLLIGKKMRRHLSRQRDAGKFSIVGAVTAWQNWFDGLRAYGGCWLLFNPAIEVEDPELRSQAMLLQGGVLAFTLFFQTIARYKGKTYYLAPVFFIWGIVIFLVGPLGAFYGIAIAVVVARVANDVEWHLPVLAAATGAAVYFLFGISRELLMAGVLIILPVLFTFLGKGKMVFMMRHRHSGEEE